MTPEERADAIIDQYEVTTMGNVGGRYSDPNHVTGVRVGKLREQIAAAIRAAELEENRRATYVAATLAAAIAEQVGRELGSEYYGAEAVASAIAARILEKPA